MRRRGFSLIELLAVVGILGLLAGIAVPTVAAVRSRATHASCAENLHQLGAAMALYANDHEGWLPAATTEEFVWSKVPGADALASPAVLRAAMAPYVKSSAVWFCPADRYAHKDILYLAQRHVVTSYRYDPRMPGQLMTWPPRMQFMRDPIPNGPKMDADLPLVCDAVGLPSADSDPRFQDQQTAHSNHPDAYVNAVRHDLGLTRLPAKEWIGSEK